MPKKTTPPKPVESGEKSASVGGRPTLYKTEYCYEVINYMAKGYSLTAFAGSIRVSRETVYEWARVHQEFSDAVNIAKAARTDILEQQMLAADSSPQVTARIFALKNAAPHEWRDKTDHEHTGKDGAALTAPSDSLDIARRVAFLLTQAKHQLDENEGK